MARLLAACAALMSSAMASAPLGFELEGRWEEEQQPSRELAEWGHAAGPRRLIDCNLAADNCAPVENATALPLILTVTTQQTQLNSDFGCNNVLFLVVGNGSDFAQNQVALPVFIEERSRIDGTLVNRIPIRDTHNDTGPACTLGVTPAKGAQWTLENDGTPSISLNQRYIMFMCFDISAGYRLDMVSSKVLVRISPNGQVQYSIPLPIYSGVLYAANVKSVASYDGETGFWTSGVSSGDYSGILYWPSFTITRTTFSNNPSAGHKVVAGNANIFNLNVGTRKVGPPNQKAAGPLAIGCTDFSSVSTCRLFGSTGSTEASEISTFFYQFGNTSRLPVNGFPAPVVGRVAATAGWLVSDGVPTTYQTPRVNATNSSVFGFPITAFQFENWNSVWAGVSTTGLYDGQLVQYTRTNATNWVVNTTIDVGAPLNSISGRVQDSLESDGRRVLMLFLSTTKAGYRFQPYVDTKPTVIYNASETYPGLEDFAIRGAILTPYSAGNCLGTATATASPTGTNTATLTQTPSASITGTASSSVTRTASSSVTRTASSSLTRTPSASITRTASSSITRTASSSLTRTASSSVTRTASSSITRTASSSITRTASSSITRTASSSITRTASSSLTRTPSSSITRTASSSLTRTASSSLTRTPSSSITRTASSSITQTSSSSITQTASSSLTRTPSSSITQTSSSSITQTASSSLTGTPSSSITQTSSSSITQTASSSLTGTPSASMTGSATPTSTRTAKPTRTPTPTPPIRVVEVDECDNEEEDLIIVENTYTTKVITTRNVCDFALDTCAAQLDVLNGPSVFPQVNHTGHHQHNHTGSWQQASDDDDDDHSHTGYRALEAVPQEAAAAVEAEADFSVPLGA